MLLVIRMLIEVMIMVRMFCQNSFGVEVGALGRHMERNRGLG